MRRVRQTVIKNKTKMSRFKVALWEQGQTLVEIITAIAVVLLVLVALIIAVTNSLSNAQFSRNKAIALKYSQEVTEWLRDQRDQGWGAFYAYAGAAPGGTTYCFTNLAWPASPGACAQTDVIIDAFGLFRRNVTLIQSAADRVQINVTVTWNETQRSPSVVITTYLTRWR